MNDPVTQPRGGGWKQHVRTTCSRLPFPSARIRRRLAGRARPVWAAIRRWLPWYRPGPTAEYRRWWRRFGRISRSQRRWVQRQLQGRQASPVLDVVIQLAAHQTEFLGDTVDSVCQQLGGGWRLWIVVQDAGALPACSGLCRGQHLGEIVLVWSLAEYAERREWASIEPQQSEPAVMLLEPGVRLHPLALWLIRDTLAQRPDARLVYSDEDRLDRHGRHYDPFFKPEWNTDLALGRNLAGGFCVVPGGLFQAAVRADQCGGVHALSLFVAAEGEDGLVHLPRVLQHHLTRGLGPADTDAVQRYLLRHHCAATVERSPLDPQRIRVRYPVPVPAPRVTLIIPTRNGLDVLRPCVTSILERTAYPFYEIQIVDNGSDDPETLSYLDSLAQGPYADRVQVIRDDIPFNYSRLNNRAVARCDAPVIALVNNDIEVIDRHWLNDMVGHALRPDTGAVGARLLFPDGTLQHAGVTVGFGGVAGHFMRYTHPGEGRNASRVLDTQEFTAVTAACMVMRREVFLEVGGLEEEGLPVAFNDVDLCLKLRAHGYRNRYTPYALLFHHESATRGPETASPEKRERAAREVAFLQSRWGTQGYEDPFGSPNLSATDERGRCSFPPRTGRFAGRRELNAPELAGGRARGE